MTDKTQLKHTIEFGEEDESGRITWECSCGHGGSAPSYRVEEAAERHVPEGVLVSHRTRGVG